MSREYWYGHFAETNLNTHPERKDVLRPSGLFVFNGKSIARSNPDPSRCYDIADSQSLVASQPVVSSPNRLGRSTSPLASPKKLPAPTSSSPLIKPPRIQDDNNRYYNRLETPTPEVIDDYQRVVREAQVNAYKHIYVDDSFLHPYRASSVASSSSPIKERVITQASRMLVRGSKQTTTLKKALATPITVPTTSNLTDRKRHPPRQGSGT